jgi:hypothetical protein
MVDFPPFEPGPYSANDRIIDEETILGGVGEPEF